MAYLFLAFLASVGTSLVDSTSVSGCQILDCSTGMLLEWSLDGNSLRGRMAAKAAGYVAIGLPGGGSRTMVSSDGLPTDMIIGWDDSDPSGIVRDFSTTTFASPIIDDSQDVAFTGGGYMNSTGVLSISWQRSLVTLDTEGADRAITPGVRQTVLWAINSAPNAVAPTADGGYVLRQHGLQERGSVLLDFGAPAFATCAAAQAATCGTAAPSTPAQTAFSALRAQCLSNGWPAAEAGGDRDGGTATPRSGALPVPPCMTSSDGLLTIGWRVDPGGILRMSLVNRAGGWAAVGFSSSQAMVGADTIMVAAAPPSGASTCSGLSTCSTAVVDGTALSHAFPTPDDALPLPAAGGSQDVNLVDASVGPDGTAALTFTRLLRTGDVNDADLSSAAPPLFLLWAYSSSAVSAAMPLSASSSPLHSRAGFSALRINMTAQAAYCAAGVVVETSEPGHAGRAAHGALMVLAYWLFLFVGACIGRYRELLPGLVLAPSAVAAGAGAGPSATPPPQFSGAAGLVDVGVDDIPTVTSVAPAMGGGGQGAVSAFFRKDPWFVAHTLLQVSGVFFAIIAVCIVMAETGADQLQWGTHQQVGAATLVFTVLQVILAASRPLPGAPRRYQWLMLHRALALVCFALAFAAVPLGVTRFGRWSPGTAAVVALHTLSAALFIVIGMTLTIYHKGESGLWRSKRLPTRLAVNDGDGPSQVETQAAATKQVTAHHLAHKHLRWGAFSALTCLITIFTFAIIGIIGRPPVAGDATDAVSQFFAPTPIAPHVQSTGSTGGYPGGEQALCMADYNYTIPSQDTSYICRSYAFPSNVSLHALRFEPMVDPQGAPYVHHMVLFPTSYDASKQGYFDCDVFPDGATGILWVWAVGMSAFSLPSRVGLPVGGGPNGVQHAILQIHFSNPNGVVGVKDNSGVLIRVSDMLKPIESGYFVVGANIAQVSIPPGGQYGMNVSCTSAQTAHLPPALSINRLTPDYVAFASFKHMHQLGRRIWTQQWRNGRRLTANGTDPFGAVQSFDFHAQRTDALATTFVPGDVFTTTCVWENTVAAGQASGNPVAAANKTVGGCESTSCEMCMDFIVCTNHAIVGEGCSTPPFAPSTCSNTILA